jgi:uncharacterized protein YabN with tetrapyrrole methylase and pyrophosphatase domain
MNQAHNAPTGAAQQRLIEVPWKLVVPEVDIHLVGYGNRLPNDFTLEMLAVLQRCKQIFGVPPIHAPEFKIPPMQSLLGLYSPDKHRSETYREMIDIVLMAAAADPPVAFATYGSALVGTYATHRILEVAPQHGLTVHVTNATSSFDGIWADLNIDPLLGVQIWEASMFLRLDIIPNTHAHLLLPQAPVLDVSTGIDPVKMQMALSSSTPALRDRLLRYYPPDHNVHFDTTGSGAGPYLRAPDIETVALRDLDHPGRQQASTLIVPRVEHSRTLTPISQHKGRFAPN